MFKNLKHNHSLQEAPQKPNLLPHILLQKLLSIYLRMILKQLGFEQKQPTLLHIDNMSALQMINDNTSPTDRCRHLDIRYWQIQEWAGGPQAHI